jgi:hypothetical protein
VQPQSGGASRPYNNVYERLVRDQHDLVGAVAYALYKADKREYIRRNTLGATDEKVLDYHHQIGEQVLDGLRLRAVQALSSYTATAAVEAATAATQKAQAPAFDEIKRQVVTVADQTKFWSAVSARSVALGILMLIFIALDRNGMNPLAPILPKPGEIKAVDTKPAETEKR